MISLVGVLITALGAVAVALIGKGSDKQSSPPANSASPSCAKKLKITSPRSGKDVSGQAGVVVSGEACGLANGESGWLFDYDYDDGYFHADYRGDRPKAVVSKNGHWRFPDQPIGSPGDDETIYTITLVLASPECSRTLLKLKASDDDYKVQKLPTGCRSLDQVDVPVTWK